MAKSRTRKRRRLLPPSTFTAVSMNTRGGKRSANSATSSTHSDSLYAVWTEADNQTMLQVLLDHKSEAGDKKTFQRKTWNAVVEKLNPPSKGATKTIASCKSKYTQIREIFDSIEALRGTSGFSWSPENGIGLTGSSPGEETEVWNTYKAHKPKHSTYCEKGWVLYDDAKALLGTARPRGLNAYHPTLSMFYSQQGPEDASTSSASNQSLRTMDIEDPGPLSSEHQPIPMAPLEVPADDAPLNDADMDTRPLPLEPPPTSPPSSPFSMISKHLFSTHNPSSPSVNRTPSQTTARSSSGTGSKRGRGAAIHLSSINHNIANMGSVFTSVSDRRQQQLTQMHEDQLQQQREGALRVDALLQQRELDRANREIRRQEYDERREREREERKWQRSLDLERQRREWDREEWNRRNRDEDPLTRALELAQETYPDLSIDAKALMIEILQDVSNARVYLAIKSGDIRDAWMKRRFSEKGVNM